MECRLESFSGEHRDGGASSLLLFPIVKWHEMYEKLDVYNLPISCNFHVSGIFQKPHRQATHPFLGYFGVPEMEPPGGKARAARRHVTEHPVFWDFDEPPGGDEHPPGDVSQFGSIVVFWGFWVDSVQGKR